jgi:hypothetical protein
VGFIECLKHTRNIYKKEVKNMTKLKSVYEKEKFIEELLHKGEYESLFSMFLIEIINTPWFHYFINQMSIMQKSSTITSYDSYYENGRIYISYYRALTDHMVILHEFGHFVFDKMLDKKEDAIIANTFKNEVALLVEDEEYLTKLHQKYCPSTTWRKFCKSEKYCPIMLTDGISILNKKRTDGISHNTHYTYYPIEFLATELFAEAFETEVRQYKVPLSIYNDICPQTYSYIKKRIYEVLKPF